MKGNDDPKTMFFQFVLLFLYQNNGRWPIVTDLPYGRESWAKFLGEIERQHLELCFQNDDYDMASAY